MQSFDLRDYDLDTEYRNRKSNQLEYRFIINQVTANTQAFSQCRHTSGYRIRIIVFIALMLIALAGTTSISEAQSSSSRNVSGGAVSPSIEFALIMGDYYFKNQQYTEAISHFEHAISQMPESLFELMPEQAIVFWQLGEALEQGKCLYDALVSYERFLELAGEGATDTAITYVSDLRLAMNDLSVNDLSLCTLLK